MAKKGTLMAGDGGDVTAPDDEPGDETPDREEKSSGKTAVKKKPATPFFTIYKKGQGKWTRLGTAAAAGLLACLTAYKLYDWVLPYLPVPVVGAEDHSAQYKKILVGSCAGVLAILALVIFWVGNKPSNVDFMIATDGEMKKVNWTTRGELFGSTRVVVLFLIFIGCFLALVDVIFAWFFHLIHVLQ